MANKRKASTQRSAPKLFRCSGYGGCNMVFTRSEHLARHERKHTGEKPYKCVVPGCERMFSRFDNMMQHTQTHERIKRNSISLVNANEKKSCPSDSNEFIVKPEPHHIDNKRQSIYEWAAPSNNKAPPLEPSSMLNSRTLPFPTRRASHSSNLSPMHSGHFSPSLQHQRPTQSTYYQTSTDNNLPPIYNSKIPRNRFSWPIRRESHHNNGYYSHNQSPPPPPPVSSHSYTYQDANSYYGSRRLSSASTSTTSSTNDSLVLPVYQISDPHTIAARKRILIDDLCLPIEDLKNIQLGERSVSPLSTPKRMDSPSPNLKSNTVDITSDEFEALEGFSKFHSTSVVAPVSPPQEGLTPSPILRNQSPNYASQVCAMRQRVMSINESCLR